MNLWLNGTSHRALMAPETGTGSAPAGTGGDATSSSNPTGGPSSPSPAATSAAPSSDATGSAAPAGATEAAPAGDTAPVADAGRSLLEAAPGKPKSEAASASPQSPAKPGDAPAPADAASSSAKPADGKPDTPKAEAKADAKEPGKADDPAKPKDDPAKATDPAKTEAPAPAPPAVLSLEDLKLPEGLKLLDEPAKAFLETLNKADLAPKDRAQGLLDLHLAEMTRVATDIAKQRDDHQRKVWNEFNIERKNELKRELGPRFDTQLSIAKAVIEEYGGTPEQKAMLFDELSEDKGTGMGNSVRLVRMLANIGTLMNVFEDNIVPANPKAPTMPKGSPGSGKTGWYDNPNGAGR